MSTRMSDDSTGSSVVWNAIPRSQWGTPPAMQYREVRQVGKGTYGDVFLGTNLLTKETVALKKVSWKHADEKHRSRGFPVNALREIRLLKHKCSHPNLVKLLDVAAYVSSVNNVGDKSGNVKKDSSGRGGKGGNGWEDEDSADDGFVYLVFEYVDHDLAGILDIWREKNIIMDLPTVKCLIKQLLEAMVYLHSQNICHRDLKSSNLLISRDYHLKLADFGLARELNTDGLLTTKVVTLWYRAPELLLGDTRYTFGVDMWSVGCILVELLKNTPLFPGKDDLDQLRRIFSICGWPSGSDWADHMELPGAKNLARLDRDPNAAIAAGLSVALSVEDYCAKKGLDPDAGHLAGRLLALDPARRCSAQQALQSKFMADAPAPNKIPPMAIGASWHEWETRKAKKSAAAKQAAQQQTSMSESVPASRSQIDESTVSGLSQEGGDESKSRRDSKAADEDRSKRESDAGDESRKSRKDRKRDSSPSRGHRSQRQGSEDSRDRRRRRSRSARRRDRRKEGDKSSASGKRRRSRSPSSRKRRRG